MASNTKALVDRFLSDDDTSLLDLQATLSNAEIRDHLRDRYGVAVSVETVRRWVAIACQPTTCTCDDPQPTPTASPDAGACGHCHRLILVDGAA